jgi:hypothetical protein
VKGSVQRRVLLPFYPKMVGDSESEKIMVETGLTGSVQSKPLPGVPDSTFPESDT